MPKNNNKIQGFFTIVPGTGAAADLKQVGHVLGALAVFGLRSGRILRQRRAGEGQGAHRGGIVVYSGEVWGRVGHPDDLSRCATEDEFLEKLTIALKNQRHATRAGGYYGTIIADVRKGGAYSSYQAV